MRLRRNSPRGYFPTKEKHSAAEHAAPGAARGGCGAEAAPLADLGRRHRRLAQRRGRALEGRGRHLAGAAVGREALVALGGREAAVGGLDHRLRENAAALVGADKVEELDHHAASTDMGDLSHIMPVTHPWVGGVSGNAHTRDFCVSDPDMAYLVSAQAMAHTIIDLLYDHAAEAEAILADYTPPMTRESYVKFWEDIAAKK